MLTLISVASKIAVVFGYCSLNTDGIVCLIVSRSGHIGNDPSRKYKKLIHEVNILDTDEGDFSHKC